MRRLLRSPSIRVAGKLRKLPGTCWKLSTTVCTNADEPWRRDKGCEKGRAQGASKGLDQRGGVSGTWGKAEVGGGGGPVCGHSPEPACLRRVGGDVSQAARPMRCPCQPDDRGCSRPCRPQRSMPNPRVHGSEALGSWVA